MSTIPRVLTHLTRAEIRSALAVAHREVFGEDAPPERLAVASAQAWLETGNGTACWCFNFGNVDAPRDFAGDVFELTAREVIHGKDVMMTKKLCAFSSAAEGAAYQWQRLQDAFPRSLEAFGTGDGDAAARALKSEGYFTAPVETYAHTLAALVREYGRAFPVGSDDA